MTKNTASANIRLVWKNLTGINTLAYYESSLIMEEKSFIKLEPGPPGSAYNQDPEDPGTTLKTTSSKGSIPQRLYLVGASHRYLSHGTLSYGESSVRLASLY